MEPGSHDPFSLERRTIGTALSALPATTMLLHSSINVSGVTAGLEYGLDTNSVRDRGVLRFRASLGVRSTSAELSHSFLLGKHSRSSFAESTLLSNHKFHNDLASLLVSVQRRR